MMIAMTIATISKGKAMEANAKNTAMAQSLFDLIFPKDMRVQAGLTDEEASVIYGMWKNSPVGSKQFAISPEVDKKHISALKTKGYLAGFGSGIELTEKGRKVIVEMVTHEPNSLDKQAKEVAYSVVKAKVNKRPIQALVKKQASKTPETPSFNLKRVSLRKLSGE